MCKIYFYLLIFIYISLVIDAKLLSKIDTSNIFKQIFQKCKPKKIKESELKKIT